jgi:hypothetical protein
VRTSLQKKGQYLQNWRARAVQKATRLQQFINGWLFYRDCESLRKQVSLYYPRLLGAHEAYVSWVGDMNQAQVNILNNQVPGVMPSVFGSMKKSLISSRWCQPE